MDQDLNNLKVQDLSRQEVVNKIQAKVSFIIRFADDDQAWPLSLALRRIRKQKDKALTPELLERLKLWSVLVDYVCFPAQTEERTIEIFRDHMKEVLSLERDTVMGGLESKLWADPAGPREELGVKLIGALKANRQKLGDLTLGEWIATFIHSYPNVPNLADFEERNFLNKNKQARALDPKGREILAKLLKVYDLLRPLEAGNYYFQALAQGKDLFVEEEKQVRLGRALGRTARLQDGRAGVRSFQDIRTQGKSPRVPPRAPRGVGQGSRPVPLGQGQGQVSPRAATTQGINPPPRVPVLPPDFKIKPRLEIEKPTKPSFQNQISPKSEQVPSPSSQVEPETPREAGALTVGELERAAQRGDPVEEERLRKMIRQGFNKLSPEARQYVSNSPFWAE